MHIEFKLVARIAAAQRERKAIDDLDIDIGEYGNAFFDGAFIAIIARIAVDQRRDTGSFGCAPEADEIERVIVGLEDRQVRLDGAARIIGAHGPFDRIVAVAAREPNLLREDFLIDIGVLPGDRFGKPRGNREEVGIAEGCAVVDVGRVVHILDVAIEIGGHRSDREGAGIIADLERGKVEAIPAWLA